MLVNYCMKGWGQKMEENNAVVVIDKNDYTLAKAECKRGNYELTLPKGTTLTLERDKDFGNPKKDNGKSVFPKPILYKGGAEKIINQYHVFPRYTLEYAIRDPENGFFYYEIKCSLAAINPVDGREIVVCEGYGNGNTRESKTGTANGFDQANPALKSAKKRAMVDAAINLAGLSSMFTQDLENERFMNNGMDFAKAKDEDSITSKQRQRLFAIGSTVGMSTEQMKNWIKAQGFATTKDIKQKDYDTLCEKLEKEGV